MALQLALTDAGNGRVTVKWANGSPLYDDSQDETVLSLLMESPWFGDRMKKRRSLLRTVKTNDGGTPGQLVEYARDALQPAIDDGRLASVDPVVTPSGNGYNLTVRYTTASGLASSVTVPLST